LFFLLVNVHPNDVQSHRQVEHIWRKACTYHLENLFAEILVQGDLTVEDPLKTYWLLGDLAIRAFLYHAELEATQLERRKNEAVMAETVRRILYDNWTAPIMEGFNHHQGQWQSAPILA
jgi:hypothetical protein